MPGAAHFVFAGVVGVIQRITVISAFADPLSSLDFNRRQHDASAYEYCCRRAHPFLAGTGNYVPKAYFFSLSLV